MPLNFLRLPQAEWHIYYRVCWTAFVPGIMGMMYPNGLPEEAIEHEIAAQRRAAIRHPDRVHFFKVVDPELPEDDEFGRVVGVSQWRIFPKERSEEEMQTERKENDEDDKKYGDTPGQDTVATEGFGAITSEYRKKHIGRAPHVLLQAISTRPGHERRGVAGLSLEWGTRKADELHLPAYLEASEKGVELYKRWGFEIVDELPFDAREFGYSEPLPQMCMKRPAKE